VVAARIEVALTGTPLGLDLLEARTHL
jgi:hypothetical protein